MTKNTGPILWTPKKKQSLKISKNTAWISNKKKYKKICKAKLFKKFYKEHRGFKMLVTWAYH